MVKVTFNDDLCKGCKLCTIVCPKDIVVIFEDKLNKNGFQTAGISDIDKCIGCAFCAMICPDFVIEVEK